MRLPRGGHSAHTLLAGCWWGPVHAPCASSAAHLLCVHVLGCAATPSLPTLADEKHELIGAEASGLTEIIATANALHSSSAHWEAVERAGWIEERGFALQIEAACGMGGPVRPSHAFPWPLHLAFFGRCSDPALPRSGRGLAPTALPPAINLCSQAAAGAGGGFGALCARDGERVRVRAAPRGGDQGRAGGCGAACGGG